ncbi:MAG: S4 domain-containing protein [Acidimicrobiales bacterium]
MGRDPGPGQPVLFGFHRPCSSSAWACTPSDLPPIAEFVPAPDVVEALEQGLRAEPMEVDDPSAVEASPLGETGDADDWAKPPGRAATEVLARAGLGSRRSCEELIDAGRVRVNEAAGRPRGGGSIRPSASWRSTACRSAWHPASSYLLNQPL